MKLEFIAQSQLHYSKEQNANSHLIANAIEWDLSFIPCVGDWIDEGFLSEDTPGLYELSWEVHMINWKRIESEIWIEVIVDGQ